MDNDIYSPIGDNDSYPWLGDALIAVLLVAMCSAAYWWGTA